MLPLPETTQTEPSTDRRASLPLGWHDDRRGQIGRLRTDLLAGLERIDPGAATGLWADLAWDIDMGDYPSEDRRQADRKGCQRCLPSARRTSPDQAAGGQDRCGNPGQGSRGPAAGVRDRRRVLRRRAAVAACRGRSEAEELGE